MPPFFLMLETLLQAYNLSLEDIEPEALARIQSHTGARRDEMMARVVRMAATNRELVRAGLAPLLLRPGEDDDASQCDVSEAAARQSLSQMSDDEREAVEAAGLAPLLYERMLRGTFGTVLGLQLNERAYRAARTACRSKAALECKDDEAASRAFLSKRLQCMADRWTRVAPHKKKAKLTAAEK